MEVPFKQSDWFAISDYSTLFTSRRVDNVWARFFPIFLENDLLKVDKILGLTFFRQEKTSRDSKRRFSIYCNWVLWSMDCLQLPFVRVEEAVSWTLRFLTKKIGPKIEVYSWQRNLKANRTKNATRRRLLTSRKRAAVFVSTSCEDRHNLETFSAINLASQQKTTKHFFSSRVRKQFKL